MPSLPQWFLKLPEIIATFEQIPAPVIDRAIFELAFSVGRRRAIQLMHQFGGYQVGKTFIIDRSALLAKLRQQQQSDAFMYERSRKVKLIEELERARKLAPGRKVKITVTPDPPQILAGLPRTIRLRPGELRIEFFGTEDLLRQLFELSQAVANDYRRFEEICETSESPEIQTSGLLKGIPSPNT